MADHDESQQTPETPAQPKAAEKVIESPATEADAAEIVRLRRESDDKTKTIKDRELRINELEDENRRLKTPAKPPVDNAKKNWMAGNTFFG